MSEARSQINLKTERKPAASHLFLSLQIDEQNFQQYFSLTNKRYFLQEASPSLQIDEQNVRTRRSPAQTICLRNLFEAEVCGKFICIWRQCCAAGCRSALHTQETPNTQGKAFRIAASPTNPWREEEEGLQMEESLSVNNNNLIQDLHSSVMIGQISLWQGSPCPVLGTVYPSGVVV